MSQSNQLLNYSDTSFSAGRMDFAWEELSDDERAQAYSDWEAGKGLIGGDPRYRPGSDRQPKWGVDRPFFRILAIDDPARGNGDALRAEIDSDRRLEVEVGFGRGDFLLDRAFRLPDTVFLGYETKTKAARLMLNRVAGLGLHNLWISDDDCRFSMPRLLPDHRLDALHVLFPDPWWKDQHRVKRLFSPPFVDLLAAKLRSGGFVHVKSDVSEYSELVSYLIRGHAEFSPYEGDPATIIGVSAHTHREHWCIEHGRPVYGSLFIRQ